jgi:hypothetical protein
MVNPEANYNHRREGSAHAWEILVTEKIVFVQPLTFCSQTETEIGDVSPVRPTVFRVVGSGYFRMDVNCVTSR